MKDIGAWLVKNITPLGLLLFLFSVLLLGVMGYEIKGFGIVKREVIDLENRRIQQRALDICTVISPSFNWVMAAEVRELNSCTSVCSAQNEDDRKCFGTVFFRKNHIAASNMCEQSAAVNFEQSIAAYCCCG